MTHCLASCESLISSSFAYAEPAAITAAVLSIVLVRNLRIPFLPVTLTAWLFRCGQAQAVRSRHRPLPGKEFPAACHSRQGTRTILLSYLNIAYEEAPALPD